MAIKIVPMEAADVPSISEIATAAFANDSHTILKDHAAGLPMNTVDMDSSWYLSYLNETDPIKRQKTVMTVAVESSQGTDATGYGEDGRRKVVGFCCWGKWNYDGSNMKIPGQPDPRIPDYTEPELPPNATPLARLKRLQSQHLNDMMLQLNPLGGRNMYIFGISVDPAYQGQGIGRALLEHGFQLADADDVYVWVHSSMAGYPMFSRMGFEEVARQEIDLDKYANGVRWVDRTGKEREWGMYEFRYCVRMPKSGPVDLAVERGRVDRDV